MPQAKTILANGITKGVYSSRLTGPILESKGMCCAIFQEKGKERAKNVKKGQNGCYFNHSEVLMV